MSEYIFRSGSDDKAQWTEAPVGSAFSILSEEVTEADTPDTTNNYVETTTDTQLNRQFLTGPRVPASETVLSIQGWWYLRAGVTTGAGVNLVLRYNVDALVSTLAVPSGTAFGWKSVTYTPGFAPGNLSVNPLANTALLQLEAAQAGTVTSSTSRIAAQFARVITAPAVTPRRMPMAA